MTVAIGKQKEWKFKNQFRVFVHPRSGLVDDLPEDVVVASLVRKRLRPLRVRNVQVLPGKTPRSNFKWTTDIVQLLLASVISYFHQLLLSSIFTFNYFFYQLLRSSIDNYWIITLASQQSFDIAYRHCSTFYCN